MQFAIGNGIEALKGLLKEICNYKAEAASRINCTANEMAIGGSEREREWESEANSRREMEMLRFARKLHVFKPFMLFAGSVLQLAYSIEKGIML